MHFCNDPLYHFSKSPDVLAVSRLHVLTPNSPAVYKSRGYLDGHTWKWDLVDVGNVKHGYCFAYGGYGVDCEWENPKLEMWVRRKFRCITDLEGKPFNDCHKARTALDLPSNATTSEVIAREVVWSG